MLKCPICVKPVSNNCRAIDCDLCLKWWHFKCSYLTLKQNNAISVTNDLWICQLCCHNVFPFHDLDTSELLELTFNSNTMLSVSAPLLLILLVLKICLNLISSLPLIIFQIDLSDHDPDLNISNLINSKYYTPHDFSFLTITF